MKQATYRIIHFTKANKYVGFAWNYNEAIMISTTPCENYTAARQLLESNCKELGVELRWFDGEYEHTFGDTLIPIGDAIDRKVSYKDL
jgi:hypothetical protein